MTTLHFNWKDLLRSVKLAFSFQRIWIQFTGLLVSYSIYLVLTYLAFLVGGKDLAYAWDAYKLLPTAFGENLLWTGKILYGLALFVLVYGYMITATAVSRAVYMNLKGNSFYTWKEAMAFSLKKALSIAGTPLFLAFLIVLFILGGGAVGLLGKWIPWGGEIVMSLLTVVWFIACLFIVFMILALIVSVFLTPAILAATDDDAFEGIFQSFSIAFTQPWRLLVYQVLNVLISVFGFVTFTLVAKLAWKIMNAIFIWSMGEKFVNVGTMASHHVQQWTASFTTGIQFAGLPESVSRLLFFSYDFAPISLPLSQSIAAVIMALFLIILSGYVFCYPLAVLNTGHVLSFLIIKKMKDDENLLERKDREEEDEEEEAKEEVKTAPEISSAEKIKPGKLAVKKGIKKVAKKGAAAKKKSVKK